MSYTETHVGKLRKIETGPNIEHWCHTQCLAEGHSELASYYENWTEQFRDRFYDKFLVTKNAVYEIFEMDDGDVYHMQKNPDGTYTFVMQFYNGGTCLAECLEEGIEKLNTKEK